MTFPRSMRRPFCATATATFLAIFVAVGSTTGQTLDDFSATPADTIPANTPDSVGEPARVGAGVTDTIPENTLATPDSTPAAVQPAVVQPAVVQPTARELLLQAYDQTQAATTKADYNNILAMCRHALNNKPSPVADRYGRSLMSWAYNRRGELIVEAEGEHKALVDFHRAVQLDSTCWRAVHNRGVSYFALGRHDLAMSDFTRTIKLRPSFATARFNRGELRFEKGDLRGAVSDYDATIRLGVEDAPAYEGRAYALLQLGELAAAVADFNMVVLFKPNDANAYLARGEAQVKLHRWKEAAHDFNRAISLDNKLTRAFERAAWLMATCPEVRLRQSKLAVDTARKAIELAGETNHRNLNILAAAYANSGDFEKARLIQAKAIDTAPRAVTADYRQTLGQYERERPLREGAPAAQVGWKPARRTTRR